MLYGALKQLVRQGLVREKPVPSGSLFGGGRPRFFGITPAGLRACAAEAQYLERYVETARERRVLKNSASSR